MNNEIQVQWKKCNPNSFRSGDKLKHLTNRINNKRDSDKNNLRKELGATHDIQVCVYDYSHPIAFAFD